MTNNPRPQHLSLDDAGNLVISWTGDQTRVYPVTQLRDHCPCATCREKRKATPDPGALPVLSMEETQPLKITAMTPVGSYAYAIAFSDGHDSGIYTLEHLFGLGASS